MLRLLDREMWNDTGVSVTTLVSFWLWIYPLLYDWIGMGCMDGSTNGSRCDEIYH